ncbi:MAG: RNHCP domain-containing protein [Candidatus Paceibacterota bacterium]
METPRFSKRVEDFVCDNCGKEVVGNGYRNHCPFCLYGKHVDVLPGDRLSACKGTMKPIDVELKGSIERIRFKCISCGHEFVNKVAEDDNRDILANLSIAKGLK